MLLARLSLASEAGVIAAEATVASASGWDLAVRP
jgi:hypothetical protein